MRAVFAVLALTLTSLVAGAAAGDLTTHAERTGFRETGRYEEVERLCRDFQRQWPKAVRCVEFARTPEGRPMVALVASRAGQFDAAKARRAKLPVVLAHGAIHAGEIDGKDAGFIALREMLEGKAARGAFDKVVFVFVPVFNVDGHERFGHWNRPNQVGPDEMGWRTTARNYNLNRDYVKADAPEMRAMLRLLNEWDPLLYIDLHATNGAQFQHDVATLIEPMHTGDPALRGLGKELQTEVNDALARQGSLPLAFYPSFRETDNPASGALDYAYSPRFSLGYWAVRNRFGMLFETHSWKDYATRVRVTANLLVAAVEATARNTTRLHDAVQQADARAMKLGGSLVPLAFAVSEQSRPFELLGYEYRREMSDVSGQMMITYDISKPQVWKIPLFDDIRATLEVIAPVGGYLIPPAYARQFAELLDCHAIEHRLLHAERGAQSVEAFQTVSVNVEKETSEGRSMVQLKGQWAADTLTVPAGSLFVPIAQAKARLVMSLFEPQAPDSLLSWGFFNTHFEAKEQMDAYVAEQVARAMMAKDPQLAQQFAQQLKGDPKFAANARARLDFFYSRHPSWDSRLNFYPVLRTGDAKLQ